MWCEQQGQQSQRFHLSISPLTLKLFKVGLGCLALTNVTTANKLANQLAHLVAFFSHTYSWKEITRFGNHGNSSFDLSHFGRESLGTTFNFSPDVLTSFTAAQPVTGTAVALELLVTIDWNSTAQPCDEKNSPPLVNFNDIIEAVHSRNACPASQTFFFSLVYFTSCGECVSSCSYFSFHLFTLCYLTNLWIYGLTQWRTVKPSIQYRVIH